MKDLLIEMLSHFGMKEIAGSEHNPEIVAMFAEIGYDYIKDDETAWCSASLNYFCKKLGYERTGKLDARSWLKLKTIVLEPKIGDIVVLWRDDISSWKGHVGIFIKKDINHVYILGGNQSDSISISPYPIDRVLRYRKAIKL